MPIVQFVKKSLEQKGYEIRQYNGGSYNKAFEESKMADCDGMVIITAANHDHIEHLDDVFGINAYSKTLIGKGLHSQIESFRKVNKSPIQIASTLDMLDIARLGKHIPLHFNELISMNEPYDPYEISMAANGLMLGEWASTYCVVNIDDPNPITLEELFNPSEYDVNYLLMSSIL
jgi:hypothetical protein